MSNTSITMTIAEFERLLDVYGSDRARWPVEARASAGQLVARDKVARRLLAEAEALDRALETAPLPSLAREAALADRIIAAARRSPRMVPAAAAAAAAPGPARVVGNDITLPVAHPRTPWPVRRATGGAAGLLAASLALGLFLGLSSYSQGVVVPALEEATGLRFDTASRLAHVDLLDEDLL